MILAACNAGSYQRLWSPPLSYDQSGGFSGDPKSGPAHFKIKLDYNPVNNQVAFKDGERASPLGVAMRYLLLFVSAFLWSASASATNNVTINFSGSLYQVSPSVSSLFKVGDAVTGSLSYNADVTGQSFYSYADIFPDAVTGGSINVAGYVAPFNSGRLFVTDNEPYSTGIDRFIFDTYNSSAPPVNGLAFNDLFINWQDNTGKASPGFNLPTTQEQLAAYGLPTGAIDWVAGDGQNRVTFSLNSVTLINSAVPEPGTWATMILGFGIMGGALRSRRKQNKLSLTSA